MPQHMSQKELDLVFQLNDKGHTGPQICAKLKADRAKKGGSGPSPWAVRRALRGKTYRRGQKETRGAKRQLTPAQVQRLNHARKRLIKEANGEQEVHLKDIMKEAGINHVQEACVSRHFAGIGVKWRVPRDKPLRLKKDEQERVEICGKWKHYPNNYFTEVVDGIMDNKVFEIPTYERARRGARMKRVRGHLRTRKEGLTKNYTRPKSKKNQINPGARVNVCCVVIGCKIRVWHYLPARWSAAAACEVYEGPVIKALRRHRGHKDTYRLVEDNDPTGWKSKAAVEKKKGLGIKPTELPRYSPDLMPHDYYLWSEVLRRMGDAPANESAAAYKERLKKTAMSIPKKVIKAAVMKMKEKAAQVVEVKGRDIPSD